MKLSIRDLAFLASTAIASAPIENFESYSDGVALNGLSGGSGWGGAWVARTSGVFLGTTEIEDFESYADGANLDGLNSGTGWGGAWVAR